MEARLETGKETVASASFSRSTYCGAITRKWTGRIRKSFGNDNAVLKARKPFRYHTPPT